MTKTKTLKTLITLKTIENFLTKVYMTTTS